MTLPDTFAGGSFNLPLKVAKLVRLAESTNAKPERESIINKLWDMGYFLDKVDIIWDKDNVPEIVRRTDPMYTKMVNSIV